MHIITCYFIRWGSLLWLICLTMSCTNITSSLSHKKNNQLIYEKRYYKDMINLNGHFSVIYNYKNQNKKTLYGNFTWSQNGEYITLDISSLFGMIISQINIKPNIVLLTQLGKSQWSATNINNLVEQILGWPLPVSNLKYWLQGFGCSINDQLFSIQPMHSPISFITNDGWNVIYSQWQNNQTSIINTYPKRIDLSYSIQKINIVSIRIIFNK